MPSSVAPTEKIKGILPPDISPTELSNCIYYVGKNGISGASWDNDFIVDKSVKDGDIEGADRYVKTAMDIREEGRQQGFSEERIENDLALLGGAHLDCASPGDLVIPAYLAMVVKSFSNLDLLRGSLTLEATVVLRIMIVNDNDKMPNGTQQTTSLPKTVYQAIVAKGIQIRLNESAGFRIGGDDVNTVQRLVKGKREDVLMFTKRLQINARFCCNPSIKDTPFDVHRVPMKFEMTSFTLQNTKNKVRFSLHIPDEGEKLDSIFSFKIPKEGWNVKKPKGKEPEAVDLDMDPEFNCDPTQTTVSFPIEEKTNKETDADGKEVKRVVACYSPSMVVVVQFYRVPFSLVVKYLVPVWVIMLMTLSLSVRETVKDTYLDKIATLATILLAQLSFYLVLENAVPRTGHMTLMDKNITLGLIVAMIELLQTCIVFALESEDDADFDKEIDSIEWRIRLVSTAVELVLVLGSMAYIAYMYVVYVMRDRQMNKTMETKVKVSKDSSKWTRQKYTAVTADNHQCLHLREGYENPAAENSSPVSSPKGPSLDA